MNKVRPMKASPAPEEINFPVYASPKLDGIRAIVKDGQLLSNSLKLIPNEFIQDFGWDEFNGLDGELIIGSPVAENVYRVTNSGVMSKSKDVDWQFYVFDYFDGQTIPFSGRYQDLTELEPDLPKNFHIVREFLVESASELDELEAVWTTEGYEGLMIRSPDGPYKFGRSTQKEGYLLKVKRFLDGEAEIVGFEEELHNANEATTNEMGRTARSSHKENKIPKGTLGNLLVKDIVTGVEFSVGTGFSAAHRKEMWEARDSLIGELIKYKYFPVGVKEKPRHPVWLGMRDERDMS